MKSVVQSFIIITCVFFQFQAIAKTERILLDDATIDILYTPDQIDIGDQALFDWVSKSAQIVSQYYDRFPIPALKIVINSTQNSHNVGGGQAFPGKEPFITLRVGTAVSQAALNDDWIMIHEMIHLATPTLPDKNRWLEEGLSTYVESIARVHANDLSEDTVWRGFMSQMIQGLPENNDKGLDNTHTWGRTYWGGAIFCLLADIEIRQQTDLKMGLQDALRASLNSGFDMRKKSNIESILRVADEATGSTALMSLYNRLKDTPEKIDLEKLWQQLGVAREGRQIIYDDSAPLSGVRKAIMQVPVNP